AAALARRWVEQGAVGPIYVGFDGRKKSSGLAAVVGEVLSGAGLVTTVLEHPCCAGALGMAVATDADSPGGVMLSGSDAPGPYCGLFVRGADGGSVPARFAADVDQLAGVISAEGRAPFRSYDVTDAYRRWLLAALDPSRPGWGLSVVIDALHGVGARPLVEILEGLGCSVSLLHEEPRADFGGLRPQASEPWANECTAAVARQGADLGIVLDGDAMRSALVDERGRLVPPQQLVALVMGHLVRNRGMSGRVASTLASSALVRLEAEDLGLEVTSVPVGFERLHDEIAEGDVLLACDEFGGVSVPQRLHERDGVLSALLAVEALVFAGPRSSVSQLLARMEERLGRMEYGRRSVPMKPGDLDALSTVLPGLNPGRIAGAEPCMVSHADGLKLEFDDDSWLMMRPSRTLPVVRVYAEAHSPRRRDELLKSGADFVRGEYLGQLRTT
ncbi:phosphohexomutase domain-containing protein, partial [Olsenella massiliensis]|uniref:hypothetical protein n=1 Tax=Olsenella massiliensis TaxID=1622075 RepID=UPI00071CA9B4